MTSLYLSPLFTDTGRNCVIYDPLLVGSTLLLFKYLHQAISFYKSTTIHDDQEQRRNRTTFFFSFFFLYRICVHAQSQCQQNKCACELRISSRPQADRFPQNKEERRSPFSLSFSAYKKDTNKPVVAWDGNPIKFLSPLVRLPICLSYIDQILIEYIDRIVAPSLHENTHKYITQIPPQWYKRLPTVYFLLRYLERRKERKKMSN